MTGALTGVEPPAWIRPAPALTDRQRAVLDSLTRSLRRRGYPPSMREIAEDAGLSSTSTVTHHLRTLEARGLVQRDPQRSRAYVPTDWPHGPDGNEPQPEARAVAHVPLLPQLPASPSEPTAWATAERVLPLPQDLLGDGDLLAVRMDGPAMTGAGIRHGDLLTVRRQSSANHGDIVAARGVDQVLIRQLVVEHGQVRLVAGTVGYPSVHGADAVVLGRVVAVLRTL
ncbi:transcriptional repressor LexA [Streptomyces sp. NPDC088360]|uniref:transcriptional repressor LexA n=1 Tax=Streptomyces sp. NPDC088360 TaxID=3154515 RepID=UPI00344BABD7